jgi:hypothetical protein
MAERPFRCTGSSRLHLLAVATLVLLIISATAMASTPPVQPSLVLSLSATTVNPQSQLILSVTWDRNGIPFHTPPESIILEAFSVLNGTQVASFSIPPAKGTCSAEETCRYQTTISSADLPAGNFMLIASDPLSAASDRQMITVTEQGAGFPELQAMVARERLFFGFSAALGFILCTILAILIRKSVWQIQGAAR